MSEQSKIQWTESTWNPWHGCRKVSAGCKFCYMYRDKIKFGQDPTLVVRSKGKFNEPYKWKEGRMIFTCSWSDWFIEEADEWRWEAWQIIKGTPQHTYQILTKRPERIKDNLPPDWGEGYPNVWLGVSVEDQEAMESRVPILLDIPAVIRFLSCEPLLGPVHLPIDGSDGSGMVDWIIIGGESGNDTGKYTYRKCDQLWIVDLIDECIGADVPVFVKQLGTHLSKAYGFKDRHGGNIAEWPRGFKVRQFPKILNEQS